jgi:hypothetical protein
MSAPAARAPPQPSPRGVCGVSARPVDWQLQDKPEPAPAHPGGRERVTASFVVQLEASGQLLKPPYPNSRFPSRPRAMRHRAAAGTAGCMLLVWGSPSAESDSSTLSC